MADISLSERQPGAAAVLWSSCLAMLAVGANSTAIMAALPTMESELSLSEGGVQWAVNAYLVASAACIVLGGEAADRFGPRRAAMMGMALFGLASCIIALAGSQTVLLAGRTLQGLASAFAVPSTLAAVDTSAGPERKAAAIGAWTGFLMLGFSIGPLFGGTLTHVTGWRMIFWLNTVLMAVAVAGMTSAGSGPARGSVQARRIDWLGFVPLATFMVALVFGLHDAPRAASAPAAVLGPFALAAAAFVLLLKVERRAAAPLVDLTFFARRGFPMGVVMGSLSMFSIMSLLLYYNLHAQSREGLDLSALEAGASLLPLSAALLGIALSVSAMVARIGLRNAMTAGMALIAIASAIIGVAIRGGGMVLLGIGLLAMGAGLALPYASAPRLALSALSPAQAGQGSAIVNACTFLAGSTGVAGGAIVYALGAFEGVLAMVALAGIVGIVLSRGIPKTL
ncbi:MAG: MFS transporter [Hyphomicrobiales bacterium]|nr:MFS transporter [Hyphomicrobiales bacterium]